MTHTERAAERYAANTIKSAQRALKTAARANTLGEEWIDEIRGVSERCRPAIVRDGIVDMSLYGQDEILITPTEPDKEIRYRVPADAIFTSRQEVALAAVRGVSKKQVKAAVDDLGNYSQSGIMEYIAHSLVSSDSINVHPPKTLSPCKVLYPILSGKAKTRSIARAIGRPAMLIPLRPDAKWLEPDIFGHELKHVAQKEASPFKVFHSQEEVEMSGLTEELEGYFAGAALRKAINRIRDNRGALLDILHARHANPALTQIKVDAIREVHGNPNDTFAPSYGLLTAYAKYGIDPRDMINDYFNFKTA